MPKRLFAQTIRKLDDPRNSAGAAEFFKERVKTHGVRSPQLLALSADSDQLQPYFAPQQFGGSL